MKYLTVRPLLGTRNDAPIDSPLLYQAPNPNIPDIVTHDTDGINFDLIRKRGSCSKCYGREKWSASAISGGSNENYTGYTEVDVGANRVAVAAAAITVTDLDADEDVYVYKDHGAANFSGDFTHTLKLNIGAGTSNGVWCHIWGMTNAVAALTASLDPHLRAHVRYASGTIYIGLGSKVGTSGNDVHLSFLYTAGTDVYVKITRDESIGSYGRLSMAFYSNSEFTTFCDADLPSVLSITLHAKTGFRYLYGMGGNNTTSTAEAFDGVISNLALTGSSGGGGKCLGLHELYDGTNRNHISFDSGKCNIFDSSNAPQATYDAILAYDAQSGAFTHGLTVTGAGAATGVIVYDDDNGVTGNLYLQTITGAFNNNEALTDSGSGAAVVNGTLSTTTLATDDNDLYSAISFGGYLIFSDNGEHTPYKWTHGNQRITPLITLAAATQYKFKYLMVLHNRIIGAYSGQANGDLEIRYTDALPAWATLSFPSANQFYKPEGDDSITGLGKLGVDTGFIFSEKDITRLDYFSSRTPVFNAVRVLKDWGSVNHASIASDGFSLYFFDRKRGFCSFDGMLQPKVISNEIDGIIGRIENSGYKMINGKVIPQLDSIVWGVPLDGQTKPDHLLFYNYNTKQWTLEDKAARAIDNWIVFAADGTTEITEAVFAADTGYTYVRRGEDDDGSDMDGYRIEPILPLPGMNNFHRLLEIWLDIAETETPSVDFYWRGGDTVGEVEAASWTSLGSISMNSPANAVLYIDKTARLHQIKWGTDLKDEPFNVNGIRIGYVTQGRF